MEKRTRPNQLKIRLSDNYPLLHSLFNSFCLYLEKEIVPTPSFVNTIRRSDKFSP